MLREVVYYDQDSGEAGGHRELFCKIYEDGIPWSLGDGELFEHTIGAMTQGLCTSTGRAGFDVVFDICAYSWPCIFALDEVECAALPIVTRKWMVMLEAKDVKAEGVCFGDKDATIEAKESFTKTR